MAGSKTIQRGYKYRIYPTEAQIRQIVQTFGCVRYVYNSFLSLWEEAWKATGKGLSYGQCSAWLTQMKKEKGTEWLKEVDSTALQSSLRALSDAYNAFFAHKRKHPKFHAKKNDQSYVSKNNNHSIRIEKEGKNVFVVLPKLGRVKIAYSREVPDHIISATVRKDSAGRYYVSLLAESELYPCGKTGKILGIDLGIRELAVTSENVKIANSHFSRKQERNLIREQRKLSRKIEANISGYTAERKPIWKKELRECRNIQKQMHKVSRIHSRIADQRRDYLQKQSTELIREYDVICLEDLNVKGMQKNRKLSRSIAEVSWSEFVRMLEYKAEWNDKKIIKVDRWYPSSQTCSMCGSINPSVKDLKIRKWKCRVCGEEHERDLNAAVNIRSEGMRILGIA